MSKHTDQALAKVARLDADIASLRARLEVKLNERQALVEALLADGEAIRMAISAAPAVAPAVSLAPEATPARRFTDDQVREIRAAFKAGKNQSTLARQYGVSQPAINAVVRRNSYKDVA